MGQPAAVHDPSPSALDAHPSTAQHLSHLSQSTRPVFQNDFQILHRVPPDVYGSCHEDMSTGSHNTSVLTERAIKHCSWASWCMATTSSRVGRMSLLNLTSGWSVTRVIASLPDVSFPMTPTASSR